MLFSSTTFIFIFLPVICFLYLLTKKQLHNPILLIASILFYAWGEPRYLAIMLLTILINYYGALFIEYAREKSFNVKLPLTITIIANLGFLIYFKYFNFLISSINNVFHSHIGVLDIVMPIGISFYTFQAISYVTDVYRNECKAQRSIYKLALFICLFPQLIAGPIIKYHDIEGQIDCRDVTFEKVDIGVKRFIVGLAKKVLIANTMGLIADKIFSQPADTFSPFIAWIGAFSYTFQIYFDFSGYSDMAIGLGLIFGFKFMENFNYPYISKSITEFWRRWHISLSTWFKQYVYIPLGGNREGKAKQIRNLLIVFLLTGVWHGASWNFVIWGLWNGLFIVIEKLTGLSNNSPVSRYNCLKHIYCIFVFVIGWVLFRSDNMSYAWLYLKNMFGLVNVHDEIYTISYYIGNIDIITFVAAIICSLPVFIKLREMFCYKGLSQSKAISIVGNLWLIILFILSVISIAASTYNPFIYFRF